MAVVQAIIADPNQLLNSSYFDLESQLNTSPRRVLRLFLEAVTNVDWVSTLSLERREQCKKKLRLVLPEKTPYDCLNMFRSVFENLEICSSQEDFLLQTWMLNRGLVLKNLRYDFLCRFKEEAVNSTQLYLFAVYQEYEHSSSSKYLKLLLREGIDVSTTLFGNDLLSIVSTYGTEEDLQLTLDYYRLQLEDHYRGVLNKRIIQLLLQNTSSPNKILTLIRACQKARLEPEKYIRGIDWIKFPECFSVVRRFLDKSKKQAFYHAHGLNLLFTSAIQSEDKMKVWADRMRKAGVDPRQFFPPREGNTLNPIEEFILMLGYRDACVRLVKEFGGERAELIQIPESEEFYRSYYEEAAQINLRNLSLALKEGMNIPTKRVLEEDLRLVQARTIWENEVHLTFVDKFLKASFLETAYILRDAYEKSDGIPDVMEAQLNSLLDEGPQYAHRFFYRSFADTYHKARAFSCRISRYYIVPALLRKDEKSYFSPADRKYYWRQMYNVLHVALRLYSLANLRSAYYDYTKPDYKPKIEKKEKKRIGFPSSKPIILGMSD